MAVAEMTGWQTIKLTFIAICAKAEITSKSASNPPTPKEEEYFIRIITMISLYHCDSGQLVDCEMQINDISQDILFISVCTLIGHYYSSRDLRT